VSTPGLGASLRVAHGVVWRDIFDRVQEAGHAGFTRATAPLWRFEGLEGRRPGEIARTSGLSKQAVNDQLRALEALGYVERHPDPHDGRGRVVRLTGRGQELDRTVRAAAAAVEDAWAQEIGAPAWEAFRAVLDRIAAPGFPTEVAPEAGAPAAGPQNGRARGPAGPSGRAAS
jgi:DNA-binding MarR family transcriptional regulator